jgi:methylglutaconyl-CoA hydratase
MKPYTHITVDHSFQERIATITMQRPEVHNAFNTQLIQDLQSAFTQLRQDNNLHAVILAGAGKSFSAGADIQMMQEAITSSADENVQDALRLADLMQTIDTFPCPVVARVHGAAMGGGVGLVAVCDIALAASHARFAFSEVKLGIAPAVISPYVLRKIGVSHARALFTTGERFSAQRAYEIGLVHTIVPTERLDEAVERTTQELLSSGPQALHICKKLAQQVGTMESTEALLYTAETIAHLRTSAEGQEGLRAFLEKRQPSWQQD